jgi:phosphoribosylformimino-5-aminoimidazole carboxamide ribonucleotide (ProFAR) isomerase
LLAPRDPAIERLSGLRHTIQTDSATATLTATVLAENLDRAVCARTDAAVVASGGVSSLADLAALRELVPLGVEGAIVGKALYAGAFTLAEALAVAEAE